MSLGVFLAATIGPLALATVGALWLLREAWRQGDRPDDARSRVSLVSARDGERIVEVHVDNPLPAPLVVTALARRGGWLAEPGRCTLHRRVKSVGGASLGVVDGGGEGCYRFALPGALSPAGTARMLVDVHLWQPAGRIRRHRHVLGVESYGSVGQVA